MKNLIQTKVQMKIMGYDYSDVFNKENKEKTGEIHTKLQTLITNENGSETIKEVKVTKKIDAENLLNKNVEFIDIEEFNIGYDVYYRAKDLMEVGKIDKNFVVNKSVELTITNISVVDYKGKKQYALFSTFKDGTKLKSIKIKLKELKDIKKLEQVKNKKVKLNNLNVVTVDYKTYYSIENLASITLIR